jgi:hypothetical protein
VTPLSKATRVPPVTASDGIQESEVMQLSYRMCPWSSRPGQQTRAGHALAITAPAGYPPAGLAGPFEAGAGPRPASRHCGLVSSESRSSWPNAAWHIATALAPHACTIAPPVELAAVTVTQPSRDGPYWPGRTLVQMPTPTDTTSTSPPTMASPRRSRRVSASALACCVLQYIAPAV